MRACHAARDGTFRSLQKTIENKEADISRLHYRIDRLGMELQKKVEAEARLSGQVRYLENVILVKDERTAELENTISHLEDRLKDMQKLCLSGGQASADLNCIDPRPPPLRLTTGGFARQAHIGSPMLQGSSPLSHTAPAVASFGQRGGQGASVSDAMAQELFRRAERLERMVQDRDDMIFKLKQHVKMTSYRESSLAAEEYLAEVLRLQILLQHHGIPLDALMTRKPTIGDVIEGKENMQAGLRHKEPLSEARSHQTPTDVVGDGGAARSVGKQGRKAHAWAESEPQSERGGLRVVHGLGGDGTNAGQSHGVPRGLRQAQRQEAQKRNRNERQRARAQEAARMHRERKELEAELKRRIEEEEVALQEVHKLKTILKRRMAALKKERRRDARWAEIKAEEAAKRAQTQCAEPANPSAPVSAHHTTGRDTDYGQQTAAHWQRGDQQATRQSQLEERFTVGSVRSDGLPTGHQNPRRPNQATRQAAKEPSRTVSFDTVQEEQPFFKDAPVLDLNSHQTHTRSATHEYEQPHMQGGAFEGDHAVDVVGLDEDDEDGLDRGKEANEDGGEANSLESSISLESIDCLHGGVSSAILLGDIMHDVMCTDTEGRGANVSAADWPMRSGGDGEAETLGVEKINTEPGRQASQEAMDLLRSVREELRRTQQDMLEAKEQFILAKEQMGMPETLLDNHTEAIESTLGPSSPPSVGRSTTGAVDVRPASPRERDVAGDAADTPSRRHATAELSSQADISSPLHEAVRVGEVADGVDSRRDNLDLQANAGHTCAQSQPQQNGQGGVSQTWEEPRTRHRLAQPEDSNRRVGFASIEGDGAEHSVKSDDDLAGCVGSADNDSAKDEVSEASRSPQSRQSGPHEMNARKPEANRLSRGRESRKSDSQDPVAHESRSETLAENNKWQETRSLEQVPEAAHSPRSHTAHQRTARRDSPRATNPNLDQESQKADGHQGEAPGCHVVSGQESQHVFPHALGPGLEEVLFEPSREELTDRREAEEAQRNSEDANSSEGVQEAGILPGERAPAEAESPAVVDLQDQDATKCESPVARQACGTAGSPTSLEATDGPSDTHNHEQELIPTSTDAALKPEAGQADSHANRVTTCESIPREKLLEREQAADDLDRAVHILEGQPCSAGNSQASQGASQSSHADSSSQSSHADSSQASSQAASPTEIRAVGETGVPSDEVNSQLDQEEHVPWHSRFRHGSESSSASAASSTQFAVDESAQRHRSVSPGAHDALTRGASMDVDVDEGDEDSVLEVEAQRSDVSQAQSDVSDFFGERGLGGLGSQTHSQSLLSLDHSQSSLATRDTDGGPDVQPRSGSTSGSERSLSPEAAQRELEAAESESGSL